MEKTKFVIPALGNVCVLLTLWVVHVASATTLIGDGMKPLVVR